MKCIGFINIIIDGILTLSPDMIYRKIAQTGFSILSQIKSSKITIDLIALKIGSLVAPVIITPAPELAFQE